MGKWEDVQDKARERYRLPHQESAGRRASRRAASENAEAKRQYVPLVCRGFDLEMEATIGQRDYHLLDVDPEYQRGRTASVSKIEAALRMGGEMPAPVILARRPWAADTKKLWIVDGFQRTCAAQRAGRDIRAMIYRSASLEAEKAAFLVLNDRTSLNSSLIVKDWTGPAREVIEEAVRGPLRDRITFTGSQNRIQASVLARGLSRLLFGSSTNTPGIYDTMKRLDFAVPKDQKVRYRVAAFGKLLADVFPDKSASVYAVNSLALRAAEKWEKTITPPSEAVVRRLRAVDWRSEIRSKKAVPAELAVLIVARIWK